jgi:hypothetical protein
MQADMQALLGSIQPVDVNAVIRTAYKLAWDTPPAVALQLQGFKALPLANVYPDFTDHPIGSVKQLALQREAIAEAEAALLRRRQVCGAHVLWMYLGWMNACLALHVLWMYLVWMNACLALHVLGMDECMPCTACPVSRVEKCVG